MNHGTFNRPWLSFQNMISVWGCFSSPNAARQRGGKTYLYKDLKTKTKTAVFSNPFKLLGRAALTSRLVPIISCSSGNLITYLAQRSPG